MKCEEIKQNVLYSMQTQQTNLNLAFQPGQSNAIQTSVCCLVPAQTSQVSKSEQQPGCVFGMLRV